MLHARISGLASYAPDDILDNEMLSKMVDTNDEWITTRVGIKERRILREPGKGSSYLGIKAVEKLLERTGTKPEEVDLLICATSNPDYRFPVDRFGNRPPARPQECLRLRRAGCMRRISCCA